MEQTERAVLAPLSPSWPLEGSGERNSRGQREGRSRCSNANIVLQAMQSMHLHTHHRNRGSYEAHCDRREIRLELPVVVA